jgi:hypothetical protein
MAEKGFAVEEMIKRNERIARLVRLKGVEA